MTTRKELSYSEAETLLRATILSGKPTPQQQAEYEQARVASVERYSSNPLWIARAKASGNEEEFWKNFRPIGFLKRVPVD